jgi:hypothetical protein
MMQDVVTDLTHWPPRSAAAPPPPAPEPAKASAPAEPESEAPSSGLRWRSKAR